MIGGVQSAVVGTPQNAAAQRAPGKPSDNPANRPLTEVTSTQPVEKTEKPAEALAKETIRVLIKAQEEKGKNSSVLDTELTEEEEKVVRELKKTDREVRAHEAAHKSAGGPVAGNVSFQTVTGPDGREYAVSGEVKIDASPVPNNPEATIRKMELVIRAALAPAEPSPQDRAVAAQAQQTKAQARVESQKQRKEQQEETNENNGLGLVAQLENLQEDKNSVKETGDTETGTGGDSGFQDDSSRAIVSILFGSGGI